MRSRIAALMLLALLPLMSVINLSAAPAPEQAYAIVDIGPPRKGMKKEEYCKETIRWLTNPRGFLLLVGHYAEEKKLPSVTRLKDVPSWLEKNLQVKKEEGERRLRLTFRAGTRAEQVDIINTLLRFYMRDGKEQRIKHAEEALRPYEKRAELLAKNAEEERDSERRANLRKLEANEKAVAAPLRAEIARWKQIKVIKWAK